MSQVPPEPAASARPDVVRVDHGGWISGPSISTRPAAAAHKAVMACGRALKSAPLSRAEQSPLRAPATGGLTTQTQESGNQHVERRTVRFGQGGIVVSQNLPPG